MKGKKSSMISPDHWLRILSSWDGEIKKKDEDLLVLLVYHLFCYLNANVELGCDMGFLLSLSLTLCF